MVNSLKKQQNSIDPTYFYIETVKKMGFSPQYLRTDWGTENGIIAGIQCLFLMSEDAHTDRQFQTREYKIEELKKRFH